MMCADGDHETDVVRVPRITGGQQGQSSGKAQAHDADGIAV